MGTLVGGLFGRLMRIGLPAVGAGGLLSAQAIQRSLRRMRRIEGMRPFGFVLCVLGLLGGCATDWTPYPWADPQEQCVVETSHRGVISQSASAFPAAHGRVVHVDGRLLPDGLYYRVDFSDAGGGQTMYGRSPDFSLCIEDPKTRRRYRWTAEVRHTNDGPVAFRTSTPQPFEPHAPIIVRVVSVDEAGPSRP